MSKEELLQAAMSLPLLDRISLAQSLWASIDDHLAGIDDEEQHAVQEAHRRDAELSSGQTTGRSHQQVMDAARRLIQ